MPVQLADLDAAHERIAGHVLATPCVRSPGLSDASGCEVWLKLECRQYTGSFKPRGAVNKLAQLTADERARGIVAASAGNHALGVAHAASLLGIAEVDLFVQTDAAPAKVAKLKRYPVRLHLEGASFEEAQQAALAYAARTGAVFVSAYDDEVIVAGQGTCGLEILAAVPDLDAVVVPAGGGALLAGIAVAVRRSVPRRR